MTATVEGRARFTVNVRYKDDFRSTPGASSASVLVPAARAAAPLDRSGRRRAATSRSASSPTSRSPRARPWSRDEAGLLVGYVYVDIEPGRDIGGYVNEAKEAVDARERAASSTLGPGHVPQVDRPVRAARARCASG